MTDRRYPFFVPWRRASLPAEHEKYARRVFPEIERITGCTACVDHRTPGKPEVWLHDGQLGVTEHINFKHKFPLVHDGYIYHPRQDQLIEIINAFKMPMAEKDRVLERNKAAQKSADDAAKRKADDDAFDAFKSDAEKVVANRVTSASVGKPTALGVR